MRYGKVIACMLTAVFLAAAVVIGSMDSLAEPEAGEIPLSLRICAEEGEETIVCWQQEEGRYYFFLPSFAELSQITIQLDQNKDVSLDGRQLVNGMSCEGFQLDVSYDFSFTEKGQTTDGSLTFLRSGNVPAMYIDVRSGNMDYIHTEKGNEEPGELRVYTSEGELDYAGRMEAMKGRGNYTWNPEKKPYSISLHQEADLLDIGAAQEWILIANHSDPSHLRNKAIFDFADAAGLKFSPDSTWVDLYLNGEYAGLYLLSERNEIHPQRIAVAESGSTLVSMELQRRLERQSYPHIVINSDTALRIHSGQKATDELASVWKSVDNAIHATDSVDPVTGKHILELIDLNSWVRKYLLEEIFGNLDAGTVSQYFYIDGSDALGKVFAGPVWDYDLTMGNDAVWQLGSPNAFFANKVHAWSRENLTWFYSLYRKDFFYEEVTRLYLEEFRPLIMALLDSGLEVYAAQIQDAARMDQLRWSTDAMTEEIESMRAYMSQRITFLDSLWIENTEYYTVLVDMGDEISSACYAIRSGECIPTLPEYEKSAEIRGWYNANTEEPFDEKDPIWEDTIVYLKTAEKEESRISQFHLLPVAAISMLMLVVLLIDRLRNANGREGQKVP